MASEFQGHRIVRATARCRGACVENDGCLGACKVSPLQPTRLLLTKIFTLFTVAVNLSSESRSAVGQ